MEVGSWRRLRNSPCARPAGASSRHPRWRKDRGIRAVGAGLRSGPPVPVPQRPVRQWTRFPPSCSSRRLPRGVIRQATSAEGGGQSHYCNDFQMDTRSNGAFEFAANLFRAFSFGQSSIVIRCEPHQEGSSRTAHAKVGRVKLECRFLNRASTCRGCTTMLDATDQRAPFSRDSIVLDSGRIKKVPAELPTKSCRACTRCACLFAHGDSRRPPSIDHFTLV